MERRSDLGFTLVELLTAIAVAAILFGVAVPSFTQLMERQRSWTVLNDLRTGLHQAREHAAREGRHITVCRSADARVCGSGEFWNEGWIVFEDPDGARACTVQDNGRCDHGGRVLASSPGSRTGIYLLGNHFIRDSVRYFPEGFAKASNGTFTVCDGSGTALRAMVVAWSGRVRPAEPDDGQCPGGS
ncbi:GspH/FimT family pseudopilin [Aquisalimonas sp.]|uniref:GspH/FimT family pseudopilin n=1 Tax=Aquisalimonas sp. TaxID=1872621 RepID=UPI0025C27050|nr:GspH/FimT family pseudopilin [Aquisalimonas sp.]